MRIAVLTGEYPTPRAPERAMFVADQVSALRAAGHQVVVIHREPPTLRRLASRLRGSVGAPGPAPSATSGTARGRRSPVRTAARLVHDYGGRAVAVAAMVRDLRRLRPLPDVVHAHNVFPAGVAARRYSRRHEIPLVVTEHSSAYLRGQLAGAELATAADILGEADAVIAVSPRQAQALPADDVHVVPNVLPDTFRLRSDRARAGGDIVSVGVLMPHKGMGALVEAYALLPAGVRTRHRLVIVGGGPDAAGLRALASRRGVGGRVVLAGHRSRDQVAEILGDAAVLVSASPVETFGMTCIEGLAAGVPFVAVRSGGPESIWFPGAGRLCDSGTPEDLAEAITWVLTQPSSTDAERRAIARDRFGAERVAGQLNEIYRAAIATRDAHRRR